MPLTLVIRNAASLENGSPSSLVLDRRGARIGRAPTADWCLPDPSRFISSNHCEIRFEGERYELVDLSTNGTFLAGQSVRLPVPHPIRDGDVFVVGRFEIAAALDGATAAGLAAQFPQPAPSEWRGWTSTTADQPIAPQHSASAWGAAPPAAAISGEGPLSQAWAPPPIAQPPGFGQASAAAPSAWDVVPPPPVMPASEWSSPAAPPAPPAAEDVWGKFAQSNVVDWSRGGFGAPQPAPIQAAPVAPAPVAPPAQTAPQWQSEAVQPAPPAAPAVAAPVPQAAPQPAAPDGINELLAAARVDPGQVRQDPAQTATVAGDLLARLVSGLFLLLEARARAKSQMGAQGTSFSIDGNNPLKFARTPEQALLQLLNPPERGFQRADQAVEDAFKDLQAHQMATLRAMQGALRATLDRFSPAAIRARAQDKGLLAKILPAARDAALWNAYEREFGGVVQGSDEAFMDMFAKEFRRAYDEIANQR